MSISTLSFLPTCVQGSHHSTKPYWKGEGLPHHHAQIISTEFNFWLKLNVPNLTKISFLAAENVFTTRPWHTVGGNMRRRKRRWRRKRRRKWRRRRKAKVTVSRLKNCFMKMELFHFFLISRPSSSAFATQCTRPTSTRGLATPQASAWERAKAKSSILFSSKHGLGKLK